MKVPLVDLGAQHARVRDEVMEAAREVIESQRFVLGEPVARFERTLAAMVGAKHAVGVASGSDALALAMRALGIGAGDAVVTTPLTFVATVEAIVAVGARPLFADVDPATLTLAPASVAQRIDVARRQGHRVRAILPVHLFGHCADMSALREIARAAIPGLLVIEDAAQAIGARDRAGAAGGMGDAGCFSFFPAKALGGWGDGGAVTTSDAKVAERVRSLRQHGLVGSDEFSEVGTNSRLDALHAAVLDAKARHLDTWTRERRAAADRYRALLTGVPGVALPEERDGATHAYSVYAIRCAHRDALAAWLHARGVASRAYYARPAHRQAPYAHLDDPAVPLPNVEAASRELLALPIFAEITEAQQAYVAEAIRAFPAA